MSHNKDARVIHVQVWVNFSFNCSYCVVGFRVYIQLRKRGLVASRIGLFFYMFRCIFV